MGGLPTDPDCVNQTPADGESCDETGMLCQSGEEVCVCFGGGGDDPTWNCFDGGGLGGRGAGGFGNGGRAQAGGGGRAQAGGGGFGNFGGGM